MKGKQRLHILFLVTLLLSACKIEVRVPEGGSVTTESSRFNCDSGMNCEISVVDLFFDETFIAQPAEGYHFSKWRRRDRGFCGDSSKPCRLYTAGFAGNPTLMAFLSGDELFYLEPVFEPTISPGESNVKATTCQNPILTEIGTVYKLHYQKNEKDVGSYNEQHKYTVLGIEYYHGVSAIKTQMEVVSDGPIEFETMGALYNTLHNGGAEARQHGVETATTMLTGSKGTSYSTARNLPYLRFRYDIGIGESATSEYTLDTTYRDEKTASSNTQSTSMTMTFEGIERITVPIGTFLACRFKYEYGSFGFNTHWNSVEHGILLKRKNHGGDTSVLSYAEINGVEI